MFLELIDRIDTTTVKAQVDEARRAAGFPETQLQHVSQAFREQRIHLLRIANSTLRTQEYAERARIINGIAEILGNSSSVADVVDVYEQDVDPQIQELRRSVLELSSDTRTLPFTNDQNTARIVEILSKYALAIRPILTSRIERGLDISFIYPVYTSVSDLATYSDVTELTVHQRIDLLVSLLETIRPIDALRETLEEEIAEWEELANTVPDPPVNVAHVQSASLASVPSNRIPTPPEPILLPVLPEKSRKRSSTAKWAIAALVVIWDICRTA